MARALAIASLLYTGSVALPQSERAVAAAATQKTDLFDEIYEHGQPTASSLRTLTATFVERSTSALLEKPVIARGTVAVERPSRIVLRYSEPAGRTVLVDGNTLLVAWPSRGIRQRQDIGASQKRVQQYFVDKSPRELRRHFRIGATIAPERPGLWHVDMEPTRKQIRQGVARIELWIDRQTILPASMRLTFPDGETKLMDFSDVRANPALPPGTFDVSGSRLRLP